MKTVAIISEYNPFHTGHEYQIKKIREEFGNDTRIVAIMSGNFTQRGEIVSMDKSLWAECAVRCGVNLVLEIPFPFSCSSAEFFAKSGVKIADSLGVVDYLSFGSEMGDIASLTEIAKRMNSVEYKQVIKKLLSSNEERSYGYPQICEIAYKQLYSSSSYHNFLTPNNILAIEYIKALITFNSKILPHTITRLGARYSESQAIHAEHQSATAIRNLMMQDMNSAIKYVPKNAVEPILSAYNNKQMPCDSEKLSAAVISNFRINPASVKIHDTEGGLYNRLRNASFEATSISTLISLADTKKYTTARIQRAIWYSFFSVTSSEVKELPAYTQVLAMDSVGKAILKDAKKMSGLPIVTKPSSFGFLSDAAKRQKSLSDTADAVFQLTKPSPTSGCASLKTSPYVMN